jgi:hypothetical protein
MTVTTQSRRQRPDKGRRQAKASPKPQRPINKPTRPVRRVVVPGGRFSGLLAALVGEGASTQEISTRVSRLEQTMAELGRAAAEHIAVEDATDAEEEPDI